MTDAAATSANGSQTAAGNGGAGAAGGDAAGAQAAASGTNTGNAAPQGQNGNGQQGAADPFAGLKAPEGFDAAALPKLVEVAKSYGLDAKNAQKLLDDTHARQVQAKKDMDAALAKQRSEWHETIKADKEYGGEKFEASLQRAQKVVGEIDAKVAPGIKRLLDESGYGEHPAVVRLFNYLGQANREDTFAGGNNNAAGEKPLEDVLYPKSKT